MATRSILQGFHVTLNNGDQNFQPFTNLFIRQEVLNDAGDVIASQMQLGTIDHSGDVPAQLAAIDAQTTKGGFAAMGKNEKDKLKDQLASIQNQKGP